MKVASTNPTASSLRGTSPSLTQTLVNGHTVGSADWFVLSQGNNVGRSVSYTLLPSELVGSVEVNKSSHAKLQEGGTTGTVNILTASRSSSKTR